MTTRRGFIGKVLLAAVGAVAAVYVPGRPWEVVRSISAPPGYKYIGTLRGYPIFYQSVGMDA